MKTDERRKEYGVTLVIHEQVSSTVRQLIAQIQLPNETRKGDKTEPEDERFPQYNESHRCILTP